jgi:Dullard-like phosphatase family protein
VKKIFENLIFICIEKLGQQCLKYKKILSFIDEFKKTQRENEIYDTMEECCSELIKIVFKNYKEYIPLRKITEQLLNLASKENLEKIIYIINSTILYCFNHKQKNNFYLLTQINGNNNSKCYQSNITEASNNNDLKKTINKPKAPYIRTEMKKKFCLVLDIDETILHTMNLPFENYFLLRPGVVNFLEEISKLYEIIIFTSSPKSYADPILNKIDIENKFFSYRLYKDHVIFEKGKSVKNLNLIGRDLNKIIFVDNMRCNAKYNLKNLYLISTWIYDLKDQELIKLKTKLKYIANNSKFKDDITKGLESNT